MLQLPGARATPARRRALARFSTGHRGTSLRRPSGHAERARHWPSNATRPTSAGVQRRRPSTPRHQGPRSARMAVDGGAAGRREADSPPLRASVSRSLGTRDWRGDHDGRLHASTRWSGSPANISSLGCSSQPVGAGPWALWSGRLRSGGPALAEGLELPARHGRQDVALGEHAQHAGLGVPGPLQLGSGDPPTTVGSRPRCAPWRSEIIRNAELNLADCHLAAGPAGRGAAHLESGRARVAAPGHLGRELDEVALHAAPARQPGRALAGARRSREGDGYADCLAVAEARLPSEHRQGATTEGRGLLARRPPAEAELEQALASPATSATRSSSGDAGGARPATPGPGTRGGRCSPTTKAIAVVERRRWPLRPDPARDAAGITPGVEPSGCRRSASASIVSLPAEEPV